MRKLLMMLTVSLLVVGPNAAHAIRTGGPVEANWDPKIKPGDHGVMSLGEFIAAGYGKLKVRKPGVGNGGEDEDYINRSQAR